MYWINTVFYFVARLFFTIIVAGYLVSLCLAMISAQDTLTFFVGFFLLAVIIYFSVVSTYKSIIYLKKRIGNAN